MSIVECIKNKSDIKRVEEILRQKSYRDLLLFTFGINSGLRISDILKLDVNDVKNKEYIAIVEKKTGKFKKFPVNNKLKSMLKSYTKNMNEDEPLFSTKHNNRLDRITAYHVIREACNKANIDINAGTHTLRKTFGYHHYRQFKDIAILQKIFNHSSPNVTLKYIGIEQEDIDNTYLKFTL